MDRDVLLQDEGDPKASLCSEPQLIPPEVLEPVWRQRGVDRRAGDRPMPKPALDCSDIMPALRDDARGLVNRLGEPGS
jgi:hypothetical protein